MRNFLAAQNWLFLGKDKIVLFLRGHQIDIKFLFERNFHRMPKYLKNGLWLTANKISEMIIEFDKECAQFLCSTFCTLCFLRRRHETFAIIFILVRIFYVQLYGIKVTSNKKSVVMFNNALRLIYSAPYNFYIAETLKNSLTMESRALKISSLFMKW